MQAKLLQGVCEASDGEMHAALLDLQGIVAFKSADLEVASISAKLGLSVCEASDGEMHAALLDLQASVETEIKKKERSKAEKRNLARTSREVAVKSPSAKT